MKVLNLFCVAILCLTSCETARVSKEIENHIEKSASADFHNSELKKKIDKFGSECFKRRVLGEAIKSLDEIMTGEYTPENRKNLIIVSEVLEGTDEDAAFLKTLKNSIEQLKDLKAAYDNSSPEERLKFNYHFTNGELLNYLNKLYANHIHIKKY